MELLVTRFVWPHCMYTYVLCGSSVFYTSIFWGKIRLGTSPPVVKVSRGPAPAPRVIRHFGPGSWLVGPGCWCRCSRCIFAQLNDGNTSTADVSSERERVAMLSPARLSSVCLSSITFVRAPYSASWNFRHYFFAIWYLGHPLTFTENFTEIVPGEPLRQGV